MAEGRVEPERQELGRTGEGSEGARAAAQLKKRELPGLPPTYTRPKAASVSALLPSWGCPGARSNDVRNPLTPR